MKKIVVKIASAALFILTCTPFNIKPVEDSKLFDSMEEFEDDLILNNYLDKTPYNNTQAIKSIFPINDILDIIKEVNGLSILDQDFYRLTNPFNERSLLDLPIFEMHSCQEPEQWITGAQFFWNQTDRSVFTCKNTNISSYLDLEANTLFNAFDTISDGVKRLLEDLGISDNITNAIEKLFDATYYQNTLKLFQNFTVTQRRIGVMFHAWRQWQKAEIRLLWPFYYLERNLQADPPDLAAIEQRFGVATNEENEMFKKNHGIADRIGFGDFRLEANYVPYDLDYWAIRVGTFITLPVAFSISEGILGTSFKDNLKQPEFNLRDVFDLIFPDGSISNPQFGPEEQEKAVRIIMGDVCKNKNGFLLGALDRLNAIILETEPGNHRHVGLGLILRSRTALRAFLEEFEWAEKITWNNRLSIEYLTPSTEYRFYARRIPMSAFDALDLSTTDPEEQKKTLEFINKALVDKFYPYAIKTRVHPGFIFRWFSRWCITGEVWDLTLGSDFWVQRDESLRNLQCVDKALRKELDIQAAKKPLAYQFKSVASFGFKVLRPTYAFFFNINAESTSWSKGIGDDWTVGLNFEVNF